MITGIASLIQRVVVYESTPGLAQRRDQEIDVKITFSPRYEITRAGGVGGGGAGEREEGRGRAPPAATATATDAEAVAALCSSLKQKQKRERCVRRRRRRWLRLRRPRRRRPRASTSDAGRYLSSERGVRELFLIKRQSGGGEDQSFGCCRQAAAPTRMPRSSTCNRRNVSLAAVPSPLELCKKTVWQNMSIKTGHGT